MNRIGWIFLFLIAAFNSSFGQKGLMVGPSLSFGQVFSKNIIISDTSKYYVRNSPGVFFSGGGDVILGLDEFVSIHAGVQYSMKQFNLNPQNNITGEEFDRLKTSIGYLSFPVAIHYRMPLKKGGNTFINFMAGHTLDRIKTKNDSVVTMTPTGSIDSGFAASRRYVRYDEIILPTVMLGVGLDIVNSKNSTLDISLTWGLGTGKMVRGDIKEWKSLNSNFDPAVRNEPDQFPDFYFDFGMRGSYVALRVSYWFHTGLLKGKEKEKVDPDNTIENPPPPDNKGYGDDEDE
jgi:hypothetical protein